MSKVDEKEASRTSVEYARGRRDYLDGVGSCPYATGGQRLDWWTGWLDARTIARHGRDCDWADPHNLAALDAG